MKQKDKNANPPKKQSENKEENNLSGYPPYPAKEDIYNQWKEETDINPEDVANHKAPNQAEETNNEKDFTDDISGEDLDIPGSDLDDGPELIGSEDEENNYYSLGQDRHDNLEEDKGE